MGLNIENVSAAYGKRRVLRDISLQAAPGEVLALIGPNGAGKTSLLRAISGTLPLTGGRVLIDGVDLARLSPRERALRIAVAPQATNLPAAFTAGEVALMGRAPHLPLWGGERERDYRIVAAALEETAASAFAARPVGELSGGEQQRVVLARALAQEPRVLLLDEATAHLDLKHQASIWELVRRLAASGLIVVAALHDLNIAAQYADRVALLAAGELLVCAPTRQALTAAWLRRAYDAEVIIGEHPLYHTPLVALVGEQRNA